MAGPFSQLLFISSSAEPSHCSAASWEVWPFHPKVIHQALLVLFCKLGIVLFTAAPADDEADDEEGFWTQKTQHLQLHKKDWFTTVVNPSEYYHDHWSLKRHGCHTF